MNWHLAFALAPMWEKLTCDETLSNFALSFNLRPYNKANCGKPNPTDDEEPCECDACKEAAKQLTSTATATAVPGEGVMRTCTRPMLNRLLLLLLRASA
jgi:hypothetical protein